MYANFDFRSHGQIYIYATFAYMALGFNQVQISRICIWCKFCIRVQIHSQGQICTRGYSCIYANICPRMQICPCESTFSKAEKTHFRATCYTITTFCLTHSRPVDLSILINWTSPFPILGLSVALFHFIQFRIEMFVSKQCRPWSNAAFSPTVAFCPTVLLCPTVAIADQIIDGAGDDFNISTCLPSDPVPYICNLYYCWTLLLIKYCLDNKWDTSRENLSSGVSTWYDSNRSAQLQRLARVLKFRL